MSELTVQLPPALLEQVAERVAELVAEELSHAVSNFGEEPWHLLTVDEAAKRLGRSTRWVRDHKELIGWVRLDRGALAFELEDMRQFARERRIGRP
jgi:hypothetical protein